MKKPILLLCGLFHSVISFPTQIDPSRNRHDSGASSWSRLTMSSSARLVQDPKAQQSARSDSQSRLRFYQEKVAPVASSFVPSTYKPLPFLTNCHVQTIGSVFFRDIMDCAYVTDVGATIWAVVQRAVSGVKEEEEDWFYDERHRIDTPDGDFFHVDYKYGTNEGTIILLHGLQSNSNSSLSIDLASAFHDQLNMNVACVNFRGCSGVPNNKIGGYHLGFTDDLKFLLSYLKENGHSSADKPVYVSGVSLGGNVLLKALGEMGEDAMEKFHVHGAAVAGVPFDHERNYPFVNAPGIRRAIYSGSFVRSLQERTQDQLVQHCDGDVNTDKFDYRKAMAATTSYEWEDAFIAPVYGFTDFIDYYRQTSCLRFLENIAVPTFILSAADDPLFDPSVFPQEKSVEGGGRAPLKMVRTNHGGHLGYIFHQPEDEVGSRHVSSWMPMELARFIRHVQSHPKSIICN